MGAVGAIGVASLALGLVAAPLAAQSMPGMDMPGGDMPGMDMQHHDMPGMTMPHPPADAHAPAQAPSDVHPAHLPSPSAANAPAPPADHAADAVYGADAMRASRAALFEEHGGMRLHRILFNLAEAQVRQGRDGYRWDAEGWWGGDLDRLVVKTEGEGNFGRKADTAEAQLLYSRAIGATFDLQAGARQDLGPGPRRTYATIGIEGLAPYWFEVETRLFLSDRGDLLGRAELWYDQRLTQRLVLQPRVELNLAAQDVPAQRIGRGLSTAELGLRLRYEARREFAPYVGVSWDRKLGRTGDYARAAGQGRGGAAMVLGVRTWF